MKKVDKTNSSNKNKGIALIVVVIALALATMLGLAVAATTTQEVQIASSAVGATRGFYYAELGLNTTVAMIKKSKGDFNDLLAGPDGVNSALINGLQSHRNEFVIKGTGGTNPDGWPDAGTSYTLPSTAYSGPMY